MVTVNVETGEVKVNGKVLKGKGITGMALEILNTGSLIDYLKRVSVKSTN